MSKPPRLLTQVRQKICLKHYSPRTEATYVSWIRRYIIFYNKRHPAEMGAQEIEQFLTHLAQERAVSASTQNQALCALLFLYREVLDQALPWIKDIKPAKWSRRSPTVLTHSEVRMLLAHLQGRHWLMASLLYGSGLRIGECVRLRIRDIDTQNLQLVVRAGKGAKDRLTVLPGSLVRSICEQKRRVHAIYESNRAARRGGVTLPESLSLRRPGLGQSWRWQYLFPSLRLTRHPESGQLLRHHIDPKGTQRAIRRVARQAGIVKPVTCHTLRHCFATHLLANGYDIRTVQELMGHADVRTTMIYTHVLKNSGHRIKSPMDRNGEQ